MWLTSRRYASEFENSIPKFFEVGYFRLINTGSLGYLLAFLALASQCMKKRIQQGDEVITVAAGFPTTVAPTIQNKCIPVCVMWR